MNYKLFCFGLDADDLELIESVSCRDMEWSTIIGDKKWELNFPYNGDAPGSACVIGYTITHDYHNKEYLDIVKNSNEADFVGDYAIFKEKLLDFFKECKKENDSYKDKGYYDDGFDEMFSKFDELIKTNEPYFYTVNVTT